MLLLVFIDAGGDQGEAITIAPRAIAFCAFESSLAHRLLPSGAMRTRTMLSPI
jgi:hypothetical protein